MNRIKKRIALLSLVSAIVIAVGVAAFFISREELASDKPAEAQVSDIRQLIDEDSKKPKFVGELNGVLFVDPWAPQQSRLPESCANTSPTELVGPAAAAAVRSRGLDFRPSYLPVAVQESEVGTLLCRDVPATIRRAYDSRTDQLQSPPPVPPTPPGLVTVGPVAAGISINITRFLWKPAFPAEAPMDRLRATTISGSPAVIMKPVFPGGVTKIFLALPQETWLIVGAGAAEAEVLKVAETLR